MDNLQSQLAKAEEKLRIAVELINWLALPHDVSFRNFKETSYWANQFKIASESARTALQRIAALEQIEQQEKAD